MINKFSILNGAKYFSSGMFQNHLVFIPAKKDIKYFSRTTQIELWKSDGMSQENIKNITKSDSNFVNHYLLSDITFNGYCLINNNIPIPKKVINLYISYTITPWLRNLNTDFTLNNCLCRSVMPTKNADVDKYKYSGYGRGFESRSEFLCADGCIGRTVTIFGADMSSSVHVDNKNNDILILGEGRTQGLDDTTSTAEAKYPIMFTKPNKRFVISLYHNGINSFSFVNATKIYQFKAKNYEMKDHTLYLGNISKTFTINNIKNTELGGVTNFFPVDFNPIDNNAFLDIHK